MTVTFLISYWEDISSQVPHESILGSVTFNTCFNDFEPGIENNISKFADSTNLGRVLRLGWIE